MLKTMLKSVVNGIRYFYSRDNSKIFDELAESDLLPEQIDGYVKKYDDPSVNEFYVYNISNIVAIARENDAVLDIGCGSGRYLKGLQEKYPHIQLYGIDISSNTINNYTKNAVKDAHLKIGNFAKINPWAGLKFDFIYSITVLEYIPFFKVNNFMANISDALKTGGKLYIQFPNGRNCLELLKNWGYTRYPVSYVEKKLKKAGFEIMEIKIDDEKPHFGASITAVKH